MELVAARQCSSGHDRGRTVSHRFIFIHLGGSYYTSRSVKLVVCNEIRRVLLKCSACECEAIAVQCGSRPFPEKNESRSAAFRAFPTFLASALCPGVKRRRSIFEVSVANRRASLASFVVTVEIVRAGEKSVDVHDCQLTSCQTKLHPRDSFP